MTVQVRDLLERAEAELRADGGRFVEPFEKVDAPLRLPAAVTRWAPRAWTAMCAAVVVLLAVEAIGMLRNGVLPATAPAVAARVVVPGQVQTFWDGLLGEQAVTAEGGYPRVVIGRLGIDLPISRGTGGPAPVAGRAWLLPGAARPGPGRGSFVYAPDRKGAFALLDLVRVGEEVDVYTAAGAGPLRFKVASTAYVAPGDRAVLTPGTGVLVLETPAGYLAGSRRFVVFAQLMAGAEKSAGG